MKTPMPSPRGTNKEGLYLSGGGFARAGAAYDAEGGLEDGVAERLLAYLTDKVDDATMQGIKSILDGEAEKTDAEMASDRALARRRATIPTTEGAKTYAGMFPAAAKIGKV